MQYLRKVFGARELLLNLTLREVRGKYKRTVFGQLWSLANPLALMLIYTLVFSVIFRIDPEPGNPSGVDAFALWLLCGLLPWTFYANVVNLGLGSLVGNAGLIQKVYFPRIVLPLSTVGSSAYNWLFEMAVLLIALSIAGAFAIPWIPLMLVIMMLLAMFSAGVALMLSIANVYFRDTQYFVSVVLQLGMYLAPIIYPVSLVRDASVEIGRLFGTDLTLAVLYDLNPMVHFIGVFRTLLYDNTWPSGVEWLICLGWAIGMLAAGLFIFERSEKSLAETL